MGSKPPPQVKALVPPAPSLPPDADPLLASMPHCGLVRAAAAGEEVGGSGGSWEHAGRQVAVVAAGGGWGGR